MKNLHIVLRSENSKTGPVAATYRPVGLTCPLDCDLLNNGCYSQRGHANIQQNLAAMYRDNFEKLSEIELVRHQVSGDAFIEDELDRVYVEQLILFHYAHPKVMGWGYTHRHEDWDEVGYSPNIFPPNLRILASVDTLGDARYAWSSGWQTARVIDSVEEKHASEIFCPIDKAKFLRKKIRLTCKSCTLCWTQTKNIAFLRT